MTSAAVRSKAVVLLLFTHWLLMLLLYVGVGVSMFVCCAVLCVLFDFVIISLGKREMVALLYLSFMSSDSCRCLLFLMVLWVCLQSVIVTFPGHAH